jgi:hypothetical protein
MLSPVKLRKLNEEELGTLTIKISESMSNLMQLRKGMTQRDKELVILFQSSLRSIVQEYNRRETEELLLAHLRP